MSIAIYPTDLLGKEIIELVTEQEDDEYISNIFIRPQKNEIYRVISNL